MLILRVLAKPRVRPRYTRLHQAGLERAPDVRYVPDDKLRSSLRSGLIRVRSLVLDDSPFETVEPRSQGGRDRNDRSPLARLLAPGRVAGVWVGPACAGTGELGDGRVVGCFSAGCKARMGGPLTGGWSWGQNRAGCGQLGAAGWGHAAGRRTCGRRPHCARRVAQGTAQDHANARRLAEGLAELQGVRIDPEKVQTNIVIFDILATGLTTARFAGELKERGVLANGINAREMRMVTHYDVDSAAIDRALASVREIVER